MKTKIQNHLKAVVKFCNMVAAASSIVMPILVISYSFRYKFRHRLELSSVKIYKINRFSLFCKNFVVCMCICRVMCHVLNVGSD